MTTAALATLMLVAGTAASPKDELCAHLDAFEREVARTSNRQPQWFDVYWAIDPDAIFSASCNHRRFSAAQKICAWLPQNMSMEFAGLLPDRISACYGLDVDQFGAGKFPHRSIKFRSKLGNQLGLQTGEADGSPWMRLAIFPAGSKSSLRGLPAPTGHEE